MEVECFDEEGWENVSLDLIRWNILLKQIEDLSFLTTILAQTPKLSNPILPKLRTTIGDLSVVSLLDKGTGSLVSLYMDKTRHSTWLAFSCVALQ